LYARGVADQAKRRTKAAHILIARGSRRRAGGNRFRLSGHPQEMHGSFTGFQQARHDLSDALKLQAARDVTDRSTGPPRSSVDILKRGACAGVSPLWRPPAFDRAHRGGGRERPDPPASRRSDRDPGAASRPRAAAPRGCSRGRGLGRRSLGVQPLFLTFLSDGPPVRGAGGVPRGAKPRAKRGRLAVTSRRPEPQSARDGPLICAVAGRPENGAFRQSGRSNSSYRLATLMASALTLPRSS
jgi:hypothetical protein